MNQSQEKKLKCRIFNIFLAEVKEVWYHNRNFSGLLNFAQLCEVKWYQSTIEECLASPKGQELIAKSSEWKVEQLFTTRCLCYLANKFAHEQTVRVL